MCDDIYSTAEILPAFLKIQARKDEATSKHFSGKIKSSGIFLGVLRYLGTSNKRSNESILVSFDTNVEFLYEGHVK